MRCTSVRRKLMVYHDGELGQVVSGRIERHLETCRTCSNLLDALERGDHATEMARVPDPGSAYWGTFTGRVMERVRKETRTSPSGPRTAPARAGFSPLKLAPALSIALVVVVATGVLMKVRQPAVPKHLPASGEAVVEKETPTVLADHYGAPSESKGAFYPSAPVETAPGKNAAESITTMEVKKAFPEKTDGVSMGKREAAADEKLRVLREEGTAGIPAADRDDLLPSVPPVPQTLLTASFPEASREDLFLGKTEEPSIPGGTIDDGSWGQLVYARHLADQGKNRGSEEVLNDLLARNSEPPVQEEASLLLVTVLNNQSRMEEAREVLEDAQRLFPANVTIQNYRLEEE